MMAGAALRGGLSRIVSPPTLHDDIHGLGAYVGVIGGLYSSTVAFLIYVVWEQWNRVAMGVAHEAAAIAHGQRGDALIRHGLCHVLQGLACAGDPHVACHHLTYFHRHLPDSSVHGALLRAAKHRTIPPACVRKFP